MVLESYIAGFTDGEGTFSVSFNYRAKFKTKVEVRPSFSISQHKRNKKILEQIREYFGVGGLRFSKRDQNYKYEVRSINDLVSKIVPHFRKYPLKTSKQKDFEIFAKICQLVNANQHLNPKSLREIIDWAYQMNASGKRRYSKSELLRFMTR